MTDLKALQYPRHVHKGGTYRIVSSAGECDEALDAGWVLSPGDKTRLELAREAGAAVRQTAIEHETAHVDEVAETPPVADVPAPETPKRRKGIKRAKS